MNDLADTSVSGDGDGIAVFAGGSTPSEAAVNVYANASINSASGYGILALNTSAGNIAVTTSSGDVITSGGAGINAVNEDTSIASSSNSVIDVTAYGTINSGNILTTGTLRPPAGILAGYLGGTALPASPPVSGVNGTVIVNSFADINAAAGDGIRAYNEGTGNVTVNDNAGTIHAYGGTMSDGNPTPNGFGDGISASNYSSGNITVTTAASTSIFAAGSGIVANNGGQATPSGSLIDVVAHGAITTTGSLLTGDGLNPVAGILAGYNFNGSADPTDHGNVIIDDFGSITATGGADGIRGYNYGTGTVTVTVEAGADVNGSRYGVAAVGHDGGHVSVTNYGTATGTVEAIHAPTTGSGTATIDNHGHLIGDVSAHNVTFTNESDGDWSMNGTSAFTGSLSNTLINAGTVESNGTSIVSGLTGITNTGTIEVQSGSLDLGAAVSGTGNLKIDAGATLELAAGASSGQTVTFSAATGTLHLDNPSAFTGRIAGIVGSGDVLDLGGFDKANHVVTATTGSGSYDSATQTTSLVVTDTTTNQSVTLHLAGDLSGSGWAVTGDGHGGANVADPPATDGQPVGPMIMHDPGPAAVDTIVASALNQTLTGAGTNDTFVFNFTGFGNDTVTNFHPATDTLQFVSAMFANAQAALNATLDDGHGNTVISLDTHDTITLAGIVKAQLHTADFHIV